MASYSDGYLVTARYADGDTLAYAREDRCEAEAIYESATRIDGAVHVTLSLADGTPYWQWVAPGTPG